MDKHSDLEDLLDFINDKDAKVIYIFLSIL